MFEKSTECMEKELSEIKSDEQLKKFLEENKGVLTKDYQQWLRNKFYDYNTLQQEKANSIDSKSKEALWDRANISKSYFYAILNKEKEPSKQTVIKIGIALGLSMEELNKSLKLAGWKELYPKNKADAIIINGLERGKTVYEIDDLLKEYNIDYSLTE